MDDPDFLQFLGRYENRWALSKEDIFLIWQDGYWVGYRDHYPD
jgi:hypothetical protein